MTDELPQDAAAERALLGAILAEWANADSAAQILTDGAIEFFGERHQHIYSALLECRNDGIEYDGIMLKNVLVERGVVNSLEYLGELLTAFPSAAVQRVRRYAERVHDLYLQRMAINAAWHAVDLLKTGAAKTAAEALEFLEGETLRLLDAGQTSQPTRAGDMFAEVFEKLDPGLDTPWECLNEPLGGFAPGEIIVVGARPGMGKTALSVNLCDLWATVRRLPALFFSLEMSKADMVRRFIALRSDVPMCALRSGDYEKYDQQSYRVHQASDELKDAPLYIEDETGLTMARVRAKCRTMQRLHNIKVVVLDYLQLLVADHRHRTEQRYEVVGEIMRQVKALAKDLHIPVIVNAQLNRMPEGRAASEPRLSDLRESGNIEQDADKVILIHAPEPGTHKVHLILAKNRAGPTWVIKDLWWHPVAMRFDTTPPEERSRTSPATARDERDQV